MATEPAPASSVRSRPLIQRPLTDRDLRVWLWHFWGVVLPDKVFEAFADAYFARHSPVHVWLASRKMGGKSFTLSTLGATEVVTLGCESNVLGGSGEQAQRILEYLNPSSDESIWHHRNAPRYLLPRQASKRTIKLTNGGKLRALMASTKSTRGPHPQRLKIDEVDECDITIVDAALGQPMGKVTPLLPDEIVEPCTVLSSTRQYTDGTMSEILRRAADKGWRVKEWTYRDTQRGPGEKEMGWLREAEILSTRATMTEEQWSAEVENQEPNPQGRAINQAAVAKMFREDWKKVYANPRRDVLDLIRDPFGMWIFEPYDPAGTYAGGADWGKSRDKTLVFIIRTDCRPMRLVALYRRFKTSWPDMIAAYDGLLAQYNCQHRACHDGTGIGNVVADFAASKQAEAVIMVGQARKDLLTSYVKAIEDGLFVAPRVQWAYDEHRYLLNEDIYGSGHPGDSFVAGAMARRASERTGVIFVSV